MGSMRRAPRCRLGKRTSGWLAARRAISRNKRPGSAACAARGRQPSSADTAADRPGARRSEIPAASLRPHPIVLAPLTLRKSVGHATVRSSHDDRTQTRTIPARRGFKSSAIPPIWAVEAPHSMSILVVDDSNVSRLLLQRLLERGGFGPTIGAVSAEESYAILGLNGGGARTDVELVLMDVELPGVCGYEACKRLRDEEKLRDVPVLMVTANLGPEYVRKAFNSGARDYIGKPVQEVELLARVGAALALKREMDARRERENELLLLKRQLEEANAGLQRLSTEDALTGLANRRAFDLQLQREWQRACRTE